MLLIVLLLVSFLSFLLANLLPGNPAIDILGPIATKAGIAEVDRQLHLNQPLLVRYFDWLGGVLRGNLGESYHTGQPVSQALAQRLPVTAELLVLSQIISLALAVPLGILSALRPGGRLDKVTSAGSFGLLAFPPYVLAVLLVLAFAVRFRIFPATGYVPLTQDPLGNLRDLLLPAITLAIGSTAIYIRVLRAEMINTLQENFIIMARAKGMPTWHILLRHALRPSSIALVTVVGLNVGGLIGGAFLIEQVFALPGVGLLTLQSVYDHDFLVVQGVVLVVAAAYVLVNFFVDMLYLVIDPRTRRVVAAS
jgi:peptide/nickel transport system permease protein